MRGFFYIVFWLGLCNNEAQTKGMKKFIEQFKEFAFKGSIVDLAIGIIIGGGFNVLVNSLVKDIVLPPIGFLLGKVDFSSLYVNLSGGEFESLKAAQDAGAATINYGLFINALITFLITAFIVFLVVRQVNTIRRKHEKAPAEGPTTKSCHFCLSMIPLKAVRCPQCTSELPQE